MRDYSKMLSIVASVLLGVADLYFWPLTFVYVMKGMVYWEEVPDRMELKVMSDFSLLESEMTLEVSE
jgi:hypothetical protein